MDTITSLFGELLFSDAVMRERLPADIYRKLRDTIDTGVTLSAGVADAVAAAMKDWAMEHGATHYSHWFQPMTGVTAEKHDSFLSPTADGTVLTMFSGKELIKGEPDASSFPSGGLRATFEARGYTAWDCSSPAFIKDQTLFIPTAFCAYTGEALDKKTPLLRSMDALSTAGIRLLRLLGNTHSRRVFSTAGPEQEYFLVDEGVFRRREDLIYCGRTLFGAPPPKAQEMDDQYFGAISERVATYMHDLDEALWRLGVPAKTKHNEAAPAQHELAAVFSTCNIATDQNQLTMEMMKKIALRNHLVCLLHEKPFAGLTGSGKHNNWSLCTDDGLNLLDAGKNPAGNLQFLLLLSAVIWAVDEYAALLRCSAAVPGNDARLGSHEAPPAVISIYLGDQLLQALRYASQRKTAAQGERALLHTGASVLPALYLDSSDRNRTSPFAFTGNRFEFRMVGSSASTADANTVLNTITAEILTRIAARLEGCADLEGEIRAVVGEVLQQHGRVIFNGDNYKEEWRQEANRRGLPNLTNTVDALDTLLQEENLAVFERHHVLSRTESTARYEIMLENYCNVLRLEGRTMLSMARTQLLPAAMDYTAALARDVQAIEQLQGSEIYRITFTRVDGMTAELYRQSAQLQQALAQAEGIASLRQRAACYRDTVCDAMAALRATADALEGVMPRERWPIPTYGDLINSVD